MIPPPILALLVALKKSIPAVLLLGSLSLAIAPVATAQVTLSFDYDGTDTTATYTVAANTYSAASPLTTSTATSKSISTSGLLALNGSYSLYSGMLADTGVIPWSGSVDADSMTGDTWGFASSFYYLTPGVDLSAVITGSLTWNSKDLMAIGFQNNDVASGSFTRAGALVNWDTSVSAVPEPSSYAALLGLFALGCVICRRRPSSAHA